MNNTCPHCHQTMPKTYRVPIRKGLLPALLWLSYQAKPMTTSQIAEQWKDKPKIYAAIKRHFYQFKYRVFIAEREKGWYVTSIGKQFLDGLAPTQEYVFVCNGQTVLSTEKAKWIYIQDVAQFTSLPVDKICEIQTPYSKQLSLASLCQ